jgi:hypothetical protein
MSKCSVWLLPLSIFLLGCDGGPKPVSVSGSVTWRGTPVDHGSINLFATASDGITVGSEIKDGKFSIDKQNGPTPGKYRVEIMAFRATKKTEFDVDLNQQVAIEEQIIPKEYNQASTLEAEIVAGKANELKFDLPMTKKD